MPPSGGAVWGECIERDPLGCADTLRRRAGSDEAGRRSQVTAHRGRGSLHPWRNSEATGYDARRTSGEAERARQKRRDWDALAFLPAPPDYTQKKIAHAAEQQRADVKGAREAWFEGRADLNPEKLRGNNEDGAPLRPGAARRTVPRRCSIRPLEDDDLHGGATGRRPR